MIVVNPEVDDKAFDRNIIQGFVSMNLGADTGSVYNAIINNPGASAGAIEYITGISHETVLKCLSQLWRADLVFNSFEDALCADRKIGGSIEQPVLFTKTPQPVDIQGWMMFSYYKNMEQRSESKRDLFFLLLSEDENGMKYLQNDLPIKMYLGNAMKIKKTRSVRHFPKPFNALDFPLRAECLVADLGWWFNSILARNDEFKRLPYRPIREKMKIKESRFIIKQRSLITMTQEKAMEYLKNLGVKHNLEELSYWVSAFSKNPGQATSTREGFVKKVWEYVLFSYPEIESRPIRMADVKIFYAAHEGFSKFLIFNS